MQVIHFIYLSLSNKMFRLLSMLHMRGFSATVKTKSCKMTHGGPPIVACNCVPKCKIMETRDEIEAFIANSKCKSRCVYTNAEPKPGDCSCATVCIADMSDLYCIMESSSRRSRTA